MKKFAIFLMTIFSVLFLTIAFAGCETQKLSISATAMQYGFITDEEYDPNEDTFEDCKKYAHLDVDQSYFLFVRFDIFANVDNDGQDIVAIEIMFTNIDAVNGTMFEVQSGMSDEYTFKDGDTGNQAKVSSTQFKLPEKKDDIKTIEMIIKITPLKIDIDGTASQIHINLNPLEKDSFIINGDGKNGLSKGLSVYPITLKTPEITYNSAMGSLSWKHVKNATYYEVYANDEKILEYSNGVVETDVGATITCNIAGIVSGYLVLKVRACNSSVNFNASSFSEIIEIYI